MKETAAILLSKGEKVGKLVVSEVVESFLYLLYISTPPYTPKIFNTYFPEYKQTFNMNISRLYKKGYISKIKQNKNILIALTKDFWKIKHSFIDIKRNKYYKGWDKKWRMVIYDIPEKEKVKRESFRQFLKTLGFGRVQHSCWVSCYDFKNELCEFAKRKKLLEYLCIYEGGFYSGKKIDDLVAQLWDLNILFDRYEKLIEFCNDNIKLIKTKKISHRERYQCYYDAYESYKSILNVDPFLPDRFLKYTLRSKAEDIVKTLASLIM